MLAERDLKDLAGSSVRAKFVWRKAGETCGVAYLARLSNPEASPYSATFEFYHQRENLALQVISLPQDHNSIRRATLMALNTLAFHYYAIGQQHQQDGLALIENEAKRARNLIAARTAREQRPQASRPVPARPIYK